MLHSTLLEARKDALPEQLARSLSTHNSPNCCQLSCSSTGSTALGLQLFSLQLACLLEAVDDALV